MAPLAKCDRCKDRRKSIAESRESVVWETWTWFVAGTRRPGGLKRKNRTDIATTITLDREHCRTLADAYFATNNIETPSALPTRNSSTEASRWDAGRCMFAFYEVKRFDTTRAPSQWPGGSISSARKGLRGPRVRGSRLERTPRADRLQAPVRRQGSQGGAEQLLRPVNVDDTAVHAHQS